VSPSEAFARLLDLGVATVKTADVATALRVTTSAATKLLGRLAAAKLIVRLRSGLWLLARTAPDPYGLAEAVTAPMPSYVSLQTALYLHGMIEQVPDVIYLASLARTQKIATSVGVFSVHHIAPELFDGFETRADGTKLATPEKALFDVAYLSGGRSRLFAHLPELELPSRFRRSLLRDWTRRIAAPRKRSMVETRLEAMLQRATKAEAIRRDSAAHRRAARTRATPAAGSDSRGGSLRRAATSRRARS
jgi:predicted transcriptional regulator of viral defense system